MEVAFVILLACLIIVAVGYINAKDARIIRVMRKAASATTKTFPDNATAKIEGTVRYLDKTLKAPLSGRHCAYYEVIVEEYRSGGSTGAWREVIRESRGCDFLLEDQAGVARISLRDAKIAVVKDVHYRSGTFNDATPELEEFLKRHGSSSKSWIFNKKLRYREGVLEAGETVAVFGRGVREPDPDPASAKGGYRDSAMRLVLTGSRRMPLYVTDDIAALS